MCSRFQSSPVPKDGCNRCGSCRYPRDSGFNPHPSRRTGATGSETVKVALEDVSILTRPEGRVQPAAGRYSYGHPEGFNPHPSRRTGATYCSNDTDTVAQVSILTRPGGRVQHRSGMPLARRRRFQSSPVPEDGCNHVPEAGQTVWRFQSSPVPEDGCNLLQLGTAPLPVRFTPHPSRRTGATKRLLASRSAGVLVSILTRPGGRVQPVARRRRLPTSRVSILTRPGGRVQRPASR